MYGLVATRTLVRVNNSANGDGQLALCFRELTLRLSVTWSRSRSMCSLNNLMGNGCYNRNRYITCRELSSTRCAA